MCLIDRVNILKRARLTESPQINCRLLISDGNDKARIMVTIIINELLESQIEENIFQGLLGKGLMFV